MINKIIKILNIGRFTNYQAEGNTTFKKLNIIYGENGRGKTTLSAIFRSFKYKDPIYIKERVTLGSKDNPYVQISTDERNATFTNNSWDIGYPDMEIFDSIFVNENIYSGEYVGHDHKKNLYRFVVGEEGVKLALKVDTLDEEVRNINAEINKKELEIQKFIFGSFISINDFITLPNQKDIDKDIKNKEEEVEILKKSSSIISKSDLEKVILPTLPLEEVKNLLLKTIEDISDDAEEKTKKHIINHLNYEGEKWIQRGLNYLADDNICPFCGQECSHAELILSYKGYFNAEYKQHKSDITIFTTRIMGLFSESALIYVQRNYDTNKGLYDFWKEYTKIKLEDLSFEELQTVWQELRQNLREHLEGKSLAPLEKLNIEKSLQEALEKYKSIGLKIEKYNESVEKINNEIASKKLSAGGGNFFSANQELERCKNIKIRYSEQADKSCKSYNELINKKKQLTKEKNELKEKLNLYTQDVFKKYEENINKYLKKFGAGFEIVEIETMYPGGKPISSYCIKINEVSVGLGDSRVYGEPCFRNILSQGDKNSLAYSFFLAKLDQDSNIDKKTIIFDDPISSLDSFRKTCTEQEINRIGEKSKQCIVMSHDKYFLRAIWNNCNQGDANSLQILRTSGGSKIKEWDVVFETLGEYFQDYYDLINYIGGNTVKDLRSIARSIRPILEGYYRIKCPDNFGPTEWLGDLIKKINEASNSDPLCQLKSDLQELEEINNYSKKYHHKFNPSTDTEPVSDAELKPFAERTLKLIRK